MGFWAIFGHKQVVKCLLIAPFPQSALNEEAGKLIMENYEEYFKQAKIFTQVYATPAVSLKSSQPTQMSPFVIVLANPKD